MFWLQPLRGDYAADQAVYTVEAKSCLPNDYNLFNMAGNVAEWTSSSYDLEPMNMSLPLIPICPPDRITKSCQRRFLEGCSLLLRVSSRDYEYSDTARSYIGFRAVQDYLGTSKVRSNKFLILDIHNYNTILKWTTNY